MNPKIDELVQKSCYLRLTLQQSQDIVDALEDFIIELDKSDQEDAKEVENTLLDILQQLASQGVAHNRD